ncbi:hypothetical protein H4R33_004458 [Dimargaris cristalligena]|nr:hypothetical protein H4R33_004458 [Dimargaris cristalligena]
MFKFLGKIFHSSGKHNGISDHRKMSHDSSRPSKRDQRTRLTISHPTGSEPVSYHSRGRAATFHHHPPPPADLPARHSGGHHHHHPDPYSGYATPEVAAAGGHTSALDPMSYHPSHSTYRSSPSASISTGHSVVSPLTEENLQIHLSLNVPVKESKYERVMRYVMEQRKYAIMDTDSGVDTVTSETAVEPSSATTHQLDKAAGATPVSLTHYVSKGGEGGRQQPIDLDTGAVLTAIPLDPPNTSDAQLGHSTALVTAEQSAYTNPLLMSDPCPPMPASAVDHALINPGPVPHSHLASPYPDMSTPFPADTATAATTTLGSRYRLPSKLDSTMEATKTRRSGAYAGIRSLKRIFRV